MSQDANAVRPVRAAGDVLVAFPHLRARPPAMPGDTVLVRHAGETTLYDSPEALAAAFRDHDPVARDRLAQIDVAVDRARQLVSQAEAREQDARELQSAAHAATIAAGERLADAAAAERRLADAYTCLKLAVLLGCTLAVIVMVCP